MAKSTQTRRWLLITITALAAAIAPIVGLVGWLSWASAGEERRMTAAQAWVDATAPKLTAIEGVGWVSMGIPKRYYFGKPPSWFITVRAIVLDDATEKRLRSALSAAMPPKAPAIDIINYAGDKEGFDDYVTTVKSP